MKIITAKIRASHTNTGTSIPREELARPETRGRVLRMPKLHPEVDERSEVTPYGGLALFSAFVRKFGVARRIDEWVHVLKAHLPYFESDHVITQAANLFVGGTCIEDMASLQHSEAVRRLFGAVRLPDPTTGGDFLRRFDAQVNPGSLEGLRAAVDEIQSDVWKELAPRRGRRRVKKDLALVDLDGHLKVLYGDQKEGADFSYKGKWSYHPLLVSLANTGENLATLNRPGNVRSNHRADEVLDEVLPRVAEHYGRTLVRGDSDFDVHHVREAVERNHAYFAFVGREFPNRPLIATFIDEEQWHPFETRASRHREERRRKATYRSRRKKKNRRKQRARERNYKELRLVKQWVTEVPWQPKPDAAIYRLVIRRQLIESHKGQMSLFQGYRFRYVVTNLPADCSAHDVVDMTYERCDQENLIEQMGSGIAAWRMPVAEFAGNCAWLEIARLAWNIGKWIAQLVLPAETLRWEWKRFRQAFVYVSAQVIRAGRQRHVRFSRSHRFIDTLVAAHQQLQM